jgi:uncharacterized coiled-coil protein SlyX
MSEIGNQEIKELIDHMQNNLYQPIASQEKFIKSLKELVFEDKEILEYFSSKIFCLIKKIKNNKLINSISQLFEAWMYEHRLRIKEKVKKISELETVFNIIRKNAKNSDELSKRLENEIHLYKQLNEIKIKRQFGSLKKAKMESKNKKNIDVYDWIVDIDMLTKINSAGWKIKFSKNFLENSSEVIKHHIIGSIKTDQIEKYENFSNKNEIVSPHSNPDQMNHFENSSIIGKNPNVTSPHNKSINYFYDNSKNENNSSMQIGTWEGAIVSVVGLYDKGKTFVLNNLAESNLPSGKKVTTAGLSFKYVDVEKGTKLILLDTAGSYSPVKITNECSIIEKEATEMFILDLVFDVSDYFIFVVNDFTSLDQRYLDKLTRSLQSSANKSFREVIGNSQIPLINLKLFTISKKLNHQKFLSMFGKCK